MREVIVKYRYTCHCGVHLDVEFPSQQQADDEIHNRGWHYLSPSVYECPRCY